MNILVVCQYYYPEPFRISDICETLVEKGHEVTVLTGLPNYPEGRVLDDYRYGQKRNEVINGVKVIRCFEIGRGNSNFQLFLNYLSFSVTASFKALLLKEKFDVIFVNQLSPVMMGIPGIFYKKKHNRKMLLYCLDLWPDSLAAGGIKEYSIIYKVFKKLSKWIYSSADTIAVTSSMFKEYYKNTLGMNIDNVIHLPQYAEDLFSESAEVTKENKFNFVFAGNIGDMQSVDTIVKAANELRDRSDITFHIVGDGSKLENCKLLSKELGLENILYYGRRPVSEMPQYYGLADAMLITLKNNKNISYTLPGKVQSYMAASKPIIGAINGEASQVINKAMCGLSCPAENYKELANLIIQFCNSDKKEAMAKNSYDYYIKNYSKEKFMLMLEDNLINLGEK
ncbi:glycosyltransferase family 4 protein [Robertmurraya korlensis]|uniref:glycosyltransferase family 4 protein n=1 Tax=Robertmurraya korlensis TaxID=519977 RepID=UPI00203D9D8F|nr:glycosyltransferase family 4 protein [Robertmurraya korlensis]MCM3602191.1 glycosyltransferase family 4 protein [Robertmurraya korlensis]